MQLPISGALAHPFRLSFLTALLMATACASCAAQSSSGNYSAFSMWGVATGSGFGQTATTTDSVQSHTNEGTIANSVSASKAGVILAPNVTSSVTIQSVGSQNVVSTTLIGNSNSTNVSGTQTSSNTGSVANTATTATKN